MKYCLTKFQVDASHPINNSQIKLCIQSPLKYANLTEVWYHLRKSDCYIGAEHETEEVESDVPSCDEPLKPAWEREDAGVFREELESADRNCPNTDSALTIEDSSLTASDSNSDLDSKPNSEANAKDHEVILPDLQLPMDGQDAHTQDEQDFILQPSESIQGVYTPLHSVIEKYIKLYDLLSITNVYTFWLPVWCWWTQKVTPDAIRCGCSVQLVLFLAGRVLIISNSYQHAT